MTKKSLPTRLAATWLRQAATRAGQCASWLSISIVSAGWFLLVLLVLLPWLALDFLPSRKSKQLTSQAPRRHREPHLRRDGSNVFWEMPDGEIIPLDGLEASLALKEVAEVVGGALCYEKTRIKLDA
jgi:hypothetical protein